MQTSKRIFGTHPLRRVSDQEHLQRQQTIYKIATEIVKVQTEFLDKGIAHLRPLTMAGWLRSSAFTKRPSVAP